MAGLLKIVGNNVKMKRKYDKLTIKEMAERVGLPVEAYMAIEEGKELPEFCWTEEGLEQVQEVIKEREND